jgi:citrate lyase beta subunit
MLEALSLGAALYVPATHPKLFSVLSGVEYPFLRTVIVCTEDAVRDDEVEAALAALRAVLPRLPAVPHLRRFVRVRNPDTAARIADMAGIGRMDGYVLPKFGLHNFHAYSRALTEGWWMPTLETREVFEPAAMHELRAALLSQYNRILCLRVGGNDLLALLGMRRPQGMSVYHTPLSVLIPQLVMTFKPYGFHLSAPVCDQWHDEAGLSQEVQQDLAMGLTGKTAIHPQQVAIIERALRVALHEEQAAERLLSDHCPAVFSQQGQMFEANVHQAWAESIRLRARRFGVV